ncbi:NADH-quinone oxidoreductase subunit I [bacterium]|nr:NADH-quinone oxidoreductase subunit I [bacterium]
MAIVLKRKKLTLLQKLYIFEIFRGLAITMRHLLKNMFNPGKMMTYEYPEEKKPIDETHRSEHRLMLRPDNSVRCTACMLCATVCPAKCIHIEATEGKTADNEKFAEKYTIDLLRCIYCGFCVEACPCDAIRMDTGKPVDSYYHREDFVKDINYLKANHPPGKSPYSEGMY